MNDLQTQLLIPLKTAINMNDVSTVENLLNLLKLFNKKEEVDSVIYIAIGMVLEQAFYIEKVAPEIIKILMSFVEFSPEIFGNETPHNKELLHAAIHHGDLEVFLDLLLIAELYAEEYKQPLPWLNTNSQKYTLLHLCCKTQNREKFLKILLKKVAKLPEKQEAFINQTGKKDETALYFALKDKNMKNCIALIKAGATITDDDNDITLVELLSKLKPSEQLILYDMQNKETQEKIRAEYLEKLIFKKKQPQKIIQFYSLLKGRESLKELCIAKLSLDLSIPYRDYYKAVISKNDIEAISKPKAHAKLKEKIKHKKNKKVKNSEEGVIIKNLPIPEGIAQLIPSFVNRGSERVILDYEKISSIWEKMDAQLQSLNKRNHYTLLSKLAKICCILSPYLCFLLLIELVTLFSGLADITSEHGEKAAYIVMAVLIAIFGLMCCCFLLINNGSEKNSLNEVLISHQELESITTEIDKEIISKLKQTLKEIPKFGEKYDDLKCYIDGLKHKNNYLKNDHPISGVANKLKEISKELGQLKVHEAVASKLLMFKPVILASKSIADKYTEEKSVKYSADKSSSNNKIDESANSSPSLKEEEIDYGNSYAC